MQYNVAAAYSQSTPNGTAKLSRSSLSGTPSYETYIAGQEVSGCVIPSNASNVMDGNCSPFKNFFNSQVPFFFFFWQFVQLPQSILMA